MRACTARNQDRTTLRIVLVAVAAQCEFVSGVQILLERFGLAGMRREVPVAVQPHGAIGILVVARPLEAAGRAELVVGHAGIVRNAAARHFTPFVERLLRCRERNRRIFVHVAQIHTSRDLDEDVKVRPSFAG